jgi:hypothetical protein
MERVTRQRRVREKSTFGDALYGDHSHAGRIKYGNLANYATKPIPPHFLRIARDLPPPESAQTSL